MSAISPEEQEKARQLLRSPEAAQLSAEELNAALMHAAGYLTTAERRAQRRELQRQWSRKGGRATAAKRRGSGEV